MQNNHLKQQLGSNVFLLTLSRVVQVIISVVSLKLLTRYLSTDEIAKYYLITGLTAYFGLVLINPVGMYFNRYAIQLKTTGFLAYFLKKYFFYIFSISLLSIPVCAFFHYVLGLMENSFDVIIYLFVLLFTLFNTFFLTLVPTLNLFDDRRKYIQFTLISDSAGFFLGIYMLLTQATATAWLFSLLASQIVMTFFAFNYFKKYFSAPQQGVIGPILNKSHILNFCLPLVGSTFFIWFMTKGYRYIIESKYGLEYVAVIGLGLGLPISLYGVFENLAGQILLPAFYKGVSATDYEGRRRSWLSYSVLSNLLYTHFLFFLIGNCKSFVVILLDPKYFFCWQIFIVSCGIEFIRTNVGLLNLGLHAENKTYKALIPYIISNGILAAILWFTNFNEPLHVTYALLGASFILFVIFGFSVFKHYSVSVNLKSLLQYLKSVPLLVFLFLNEKPNIATSLIFLAFGGCYLLALMYFDVKKLKQFET